MRRDLDFLEESGTAKRTHGGVFYTGSSPKLPHFDERQPAQWDKKRAIAARAAQLIHDGDTLLLDGGTTTYEVARLLVGRHLQIVTNSLPVANLFASSATTDLVLVGGYVYPRTGVSLGPYANQVLSSLKVRRTVLSVAAINDRGFYNSNLLLVETERAMLDASEEVIVVADSTKFGHQSLAHLCSLERVDCVVVDHEIDRGVARQDRGGGRKADRGRTLGRTTLWQIMSIVTDHRRPALERATIERIVREIVLGKTNGSPSAAVPPGPNLVVSISARHLHLTDEHVEILFGKGHKLTVQKPLYQDGFFAAEETVMVVGPRRRMLPSGAHTGADAAGQPGRAGLYGRHLAGHRSAGPAPAEKSRARRAACLSGPAESSS